LPQLPLWGAFGITDFLGGSILLSIGGSILMSAEDRFKQHILLPASEVDSQPVKRDDCVVIRIGGQAGPPEISAVWAYTPRRIGMHDQAIKEGRPLSVGESSQGGVHSLSAHVPGRGSQR
jgi:hypothetical protein